MHEQGESVSRHHRPPDTTGATGVVTRTTAQRGEFVEGGETGSFVCTTDRLEYGGATNPVEIRFDDVVTARTFSDMSLAGFSLLGHLFSFVALFLTAASVKVFLAGTPLLSVVGLGTYLSTAFAYPTALLFYRMEVGEATVLRVDTDDDRFEFVSLDDDCGFERVVAAIDSGRN